MRHVRWGRVLVVVCGVAVVMALVAARYLPQPHPAPTDAMRAAALELAAMPATVSAPAPEPPTRPKTQRDRLLVAAYGMRGIPYKWGAKGPKQLDCSGFTKAAYDAIDVRLPDGSFNQAKSEKPLTAPDELTRGDLLFYRWAGNDGVAHVTMYAGDGWVIGTGSPGQKSAVSVYPLADELRIKGAIITYRHIALADE